MVYVIIKKNIADRKHDLKINKSWNKTTVH